MGPDYVLAGTNTGLWRLSRKKPLDGFVRVFEKEIESVSSLSVVDSVTVAIGTSKGMKIYRHGSDSLSTVLFNRQPFSPENRILASVCDKSLIYVVTKAGIFSLDVSTNAIKSVVADAAVGDASSIAVAGDNIFVGSHTSGLYVFSATKGILRQNVDVGCNVVTSLSKGENGNVFVGTDGNGVVEVNGETLNVDGHLSKRTPKGGELTSDQVYAVLAYGDQELWIGYYQAAADYLLNVGSRFKIYDTEAFDTHGITIRTLQLSDDGLMLGSRNGVYYILPDKKTVRHIEMPRIRSNMVLTIHKAGGLYYVGTYGGGCFVYDPVSDKVTSLQDDGKPVLDKGHVFAIASDRSGKLWFGTSDGLFEYTEGKLLRHFSDTNSKLPDNNVFEIFFDSSGNGWIGTDKGLAIINGASGELRTDLFPQGFINSRSIRYIYEDSGKKLYFVSEKGPLTVSDIGMEKFEDIDPALFRDSNVRSVIEDKKGNLWVTTDGSIFLWDKKEKSVRFGFADGILNPAFISGKPVIDEKGMILMGNPDGLIYFNPECIDEPADNTPLIITGMYADDSVCDLFFESDSDGSYHVRLSELPHILKIDFSNFLYSKPEAITYEYSSNGKDWHNLSSEMSFVVYNLHWGNNTVRLRNTHNPDNITEIIIEVPYPWWIWVTVVVMVAFAMILYVVVRRHRIRGRNMQHEETLPENDGAGGEQISEEHAKEPAEHGKENPSEETEDEPQKVRKKYSSNKFSEKDRVEIEEKLHHLMTTDKPYLNPDLTVGDLGAMIGVSSHRLSQFFSQFAGQTFYDYVNRYRVNEFKKLCKEENLERYTLIALSEKAGFSSRASFFRHFKKFEGITPAEYIKMRQSEADGSK